MGLANSSLRTISCRIFQRTQRMFASQWLPCSSKFLFFSMFVGRFFLFGQQFSHNCRCSWFVIFPWFTGSSINFLNMFANTMFGSGVRECIRSFICCSWHLTSHFFLKFHRYPQKCRCMVWMYFNFKKAFF